MHLFVIWGKLRPRAGEWTREQVMPVTEFRGLGCPELQPGLLVLRERKEDTREKVRCGKVKRK